MSKYSDMYSITEECIANLDTNVELSKEDIEFMRYSLCDILYLLEDEDIISNCYCDSESRILSYLEGRGLCTHESYT